jgi:hypothetical protein
MAFKTEADRLAYEASMQKLYTRDQAIATYNRKAQLAHQDRLLTSGEQVNLHRDGETGFAGGIAFILLGVPLLIIPPLGLSLIAAGLASFGMGAHAAVKLGVDEARRG